jgi:hypothetical protein
MSKKINRFFKLNFKDKLWVFLYYIIVDFFIFKFQCWYNFSGKYTFQNRSKGKEKLLIIVAGYKSFLWEVTLERITRFIDSDIDVCVCVPKADNSDLCNIAKENGWSYLVTRENKLSLAQNFTIRLHSRAKYIYKLDEDIIIGKNFFKNIFSTYKKIKDDGLYNVGLVVPLLNINGCTYIDFLDYIKKSEEYKKKFGELRSSVMEIKCHYDGEAAIFLWENSFPFDALVEKIESDNREQYKVVPHRFSIGAIFFERSFWKKMRYFKVAPEGFLGVEESEVGIFSMENSYPIILAKDTFAGHFSFGGEQTVRMREYFSANKEKFKI